MLYTEFNLDDAMDVWKEEGREEGREETQLEIAKEMLLDGDSIEKIARVTKLDLKKIQQLECVSEKPQHL